MFSYRLGLRSAIPLVVNESSRFHPPPCHNMKLSTETEFGTNEFIADPVKNLLGIVKVCSFWRHWQLSSSFVFISVVVRVMRLTTSRLGAPFFSRG